MDERIRRSNSRDINREGRYVLYRMRHNRRAEANHALAYAAEVANGLGLPVLALETLSAAEHCANSRRWQFVLEGAAQTAAALRRLGIGYELAVEATRAEHGRALARTVRDAAAVVADDFPPIPHEPAEDYPVATFAVDSSCVVPVAAIPGQAYAAYSIRPKIQKLLPRFLVPAPEARVKRKWKGEPQDFSALPPISECEIEHDVKPSTLFRGGRAEAERRLNVFLEDRLRRYAAEKNEPSRHATSDLSPYLHFGYISSLEVALAVREHAARHKVIADEFLEELIVRRELAFNFARYCHRVDSLDALPDWARKTLDRHRGDPREPLYGAGQLAEAATYDDLWNATQKELLLRGKIHGYYRMYWGKKIIEWSAAPEEALETMIRLHDRYALDGRDPNTYANILWCFGLHDRPWAERAVFGMVRYMARSGMDRKTDTAQYIRGIEYLARTGKELIQ